MTVSLRFVGRHPQDLRWFIRADGRHAGGITVHSLHGGTFSYGIAVAPALRRQGIAKAALPLLFGEMEKRGCRRAAVQIEPGNAASLALHRALGFAETGRDSSAVYMERLLDCPSIDFESSVC